MKKFSYKPVLLSHKNIRPCSYYIKITKFNLWLRKTWSSMDKFFELELFRLIQYKVNTEHVDWDTFDWLIVLKSSRSVCLIKQIINSNCVFNLRHYPRNLFDLFYSLFQITPQFFALLSISLCLILLMTFFAFLAYYWVLQRFDSID